MTQLNFKASVFAVLAVTSALTAAGYTQYMADPLSAHRQKTAKMISLNGIWRARGYGWLVKIKNKKAKIYHAAGQTCVKGRTSEMFDPKNVYAAVFDQNSARKMVVTDSDSPYTYTFDEIEALPEACKQPNPSNSLSVYQAVVDYFDAHYPFFKQRNIDWPKIVAKYKSQIRTQTSDRRLFHILARLLSEIGDGHISLKASINREKVRFTAPNRTAGGSLPVGVTGKLSEVVREIMNAVGGKSRRSKIGPGLTLKRRSTHAKGKISYSKTRKNVGLLIIKSMEHAKVKKVDKKMRAAVDALKNARAIIVDVSSNEGGFDSVSRQIASYFPSNKYLAYYKHAGDDPNAYPQPIYIEPAERTISPSIPVLIVTSSETYSAAEVFTLAMRALPNVTHVGQPTAGILSDQLRKPLPNGWQLTLSNEVYSDSQRRVWEAQGIPPEIRLDIDDLDAFLEGYLRRREQ